MCWIQSPKNKNASGSGRCSFTSCRQAVTFTTFSFVFVVFCKMWRCQNNQYSQISTNCLNLPQTNKTGPVLLCAHPAWPFALWEVGMWVKKGMESSVVWSVSLPDCCFLISFVKHLVGRLIGKQGRYVSFLKQTSGAKIYISTLPYSHDFQICHIEGEMCLFMV